MLTHIAKVLTTLWCFDAGYRVVEDYMNDRVKFVITASSWDDNFEEVSWLTSSSLPVQVDVYFAQTWWRLDLSVNDQVTCIVIINTFLYLHFCEYKVLNPSISNLHEAQSAVHILLKQICLPARSCLYCSRICSGVWSYICAVKKFSFGNGLHCCPGTHLCCWQCFLGWSVLMAVVLVLSMVDDSAVLLWSSVHGIVVLELSVLRTVLSWYCQVSMTLLSWYMYCQCW